MTPAVGAVFGILGGLFGVLTFSVYMLVGPAIAGSRVTTGSNAMGVLGEIAALVCIVASIAILAGPGRRAGVCLLVAGLVAMFAGSWIVTPIAGLLLIPAVAGGGLAAVHGRGLPRNEIPPRAEW